MDADGQDYQDFKCKAVTTKEHEEKDGAGEEALLISDFGSRIGLKLQPAHEEDEGKNSWQSIVNSQLTKKDIYS